MQKYLKLKNKNIRLKIRYANIEDLHFILKLHNQNVLKQKFFSKKKIGLDEHKVWFSNKINEKMLFICSFKDKIGYVRYDYINKKNLSVSIAIKEKYKRKGFGKQMLIKTLNRKKISKLNVIAVIKKQNLISKKFFLDSGFKFLKKNIYMIKANA
tara:strand:- start:1167 stop:1631 length:465 start_codon:yes stop_codon:yes gene_type:complete